MRTEVTAGQYLDLLRAAGGLPGAHGALTVARYKSAGYTVQRPLQLGAAIAGAGADVSEACTAIGLPLGEAFQLRDDVLGVFGDPAVTGKSADDDLREGKQTLLDRAGRGAGRRGRPRAAARPARQPRRRPGGVRRAAPAHGDHRRPGPGRGADHRADGAGPRGDRGRPAGRRTPAPRSTRSPSRPPPARPDVRTVPGRTDRVVVVGAGLAGLAAALRLRGAGREVTVVERGPGPGGRAGRVERGGYALDTGPSVFTAPELLADTLAAVGEKLEERLTLLPLETTYRAQFADGSQLDVRADPDAFAARGGARCAGRRRPRRCAATSPTSPSSTGSSSAPSSTATSTPRWTCSGPELVAPRPARRVRPALPARREVLRRRPAAPAVQLPGPLRGRLAVPGDRRLRGHRPARHRGGRLAPGRRHRRRAARPGRRGGRRRGRVPLRHAGRAGGRRLPRRRRPDGRTASGCPPTPSSSPPTSRSTLVPGPARPAATGLLAVLRGPAPRRARRAAGAGAPHDQLRRVVAGRLRRAHPRRPGHDRPQPAGQHAVAHRPQPRPRRRPGAERRRAHAEPRPAQRRQPRHRLDAGSARATGTSCSPPSRPGAGRA